MSLHFPLILVVGMHRSGTSLLGSLLPALGVPMPGELIRGDAHNPEGYFERSDITDLQEELLIALHRWWPSAAGADPLPSGWLEQPAGSAAAARLRQLLASEGERQRGPWAIKDPRTSLLLPLWRRVAAELDQPLRLVLSVRDPAEVMVSLLQRDADSAGMTGLRAQQLWWHHNRQLLLDAAGLPLLMVDYGAWFSPANCQRQLEQLTRFCGVAALSREQRAAATNQIRPGHRRSRRQRRELPAPLHPGVQRLHQRLCQLASAGTPARDRIRLERWLASPQRRQPAQQRPGPWFDRAAYRNLQSRWLRWIDPWVHYRLIGWRRGWSGHPLFEPNHYRHWAYQRGIATPGPPLQHFLLHGLRQGLAPGSLADPEWACSSPARLALARQARLEGLHPWGTAALAVCRGNVQAAIQQLRLWLQAGLSAADLAAIEAAAPGQVCGDALLGVSSPPLPRRARLHTPGLDPLDWQLQAWLQHLPRPKGFEAVVDVDAPTIHLLLQPLPQGPASHSLIPLAGQPWVFCNDAASIPVLARLGINARLLQPDPDHHGWLQQPGDAEAACRQLGLPTPAALTGRATVLCLGSAGAAWERGLAGTVWCWPGFADVELTSTEQSRLLASWLNACNRAGMQLVRVAPSPAEQLAEGWRALQPPADLPAGWLPPQQFQPPLQPEELLAELAWRGSGCPPEPAVITPEPSHQLLWQHQSEHPAEAAVCISLHNYAERITAALDSVHSQSLSALELIVVDDDSSDDGPDRVRDWLQRHGQRFSRALLVQHTGNAGLAAARNTAFALAEASWCFVLDADNTLEPEAVSHCLAVAHTAPQDIAVVHPLVERVVDSETEPPASALISGVSWQKAHFHERNVVDAMALVRREAWQQVGGYTHIPGGWEDYDFWCKLIEAGLGGILCPQRLAKYHSHSGSMLATQTHRNLRRISRVLQERHPWLSLALATTPAPAPH